MYSRKEANVNESKREAYLDEMENRIKRMESAIIAPELYSTPEPVEQKEEEKSSSDKIESQAELSNHLSNLVIDPSGSPNFIGMYLINGIVCMFALTMLFRLGRWILTFFSTRISVDLGKSR